MMITYNADGIAMPKLKRRLLNRWIKAVAESYGRKVGEIGYMFVDDAKILAVNNNYLGHDYYTDIITFDYDEGDTINGDLVISLDTVRTNSTESSFMACSIFAESMTKDRENARSWRPMRTKHWRC